MTNSCVFRVKNSNANFQFVKPLAHLGETFCSKAVSQEALLLKCCTCGQLFQYSKKCDLFQSMFLLFTLSLPRVYIHKEKKPRSGRGKQKI